ncbi:MAG: carboxypeptidase regulatory-like domain-containing protein [Acidobacteriaceae bacterium]|nr:carboxypeptidase regulatory-like domain-containing protein [Acidobacteriaceae bacterium]MBV9778871.1 carboxypeptidase regulatory-like domain-containing protein [Acidobacteriaceae bacterium]
MRKCVLFAMVMAGAFAAVNGAQSQDPNPAAHGPVFLDNHRPPKKGKAPTTRSVKGKVVDQSGQPLEGALVTLTDTKANEKRTFITKQDGRYNFDDLSFTIDYQLQARYKDANSEPRKLSQYDRTPDIVRILDIIPSSSPSAQTSEAQAKKVETEPKK